MSQIGKIIQSIEDLPDLSHYKNIVLDTETSGLSPHHGDRICGIVIGPATRDEGFYLPIRHSEDSLRDSSPLGGLVDPEDHPPTDGLTVPPAPFINLPLQSVLQWLGQLAQDPARTWIMYNAKFDIGMLRADGIEIAGRIIDVMVVSHVADGSLYNYGMEAVTAYFLGRLIHPWSKVLKRYLAKHQPKYKTSEGFVDPNYSLVSPALLGPYALEDLHATRLLAKHLNATKWRGRIKNQGLPAWTQRELIDNEMKLVRVLGEMEWTGVKVDLNRCVELRDKTRDEITYYETQMFELAGMRFGTGSWKEMMDALRATGGEIYYWMRPERKNAHKFPALNKWEFRGKQKMDMFTDDKAKSTGRPCWNAIACLEYIKRFQKEGKKAAAEFMRCYREVDTRKRQLSTYLLNYLRMADYNGRIHGSFNQHGTCTGRLSSDHPNLQNVSKSKGTADQLAFEAFFGERDNDAINRQLRGLFIASPGHLLVASDFSGIEYRAAAYLAADKGLKQKYLDNPDLDYHQLTADETGIPRDQAKTVNFGVLYGMKMYGLASALSGFGFPTSPKTAGSYLTRVFHARPSIKELMDSMTAIGARNGEIQNFGGRVCKIPKNTPYVTLNYMDQGSCGEIMRYALVKVYELIQQKNWPVKMLLTVHDEIVYECPIELVRMVVPEVERVMCDIPFMDIPLTIETEIGYSWGDQTEYKEWLNAQDKTESRPLRVG